MKANYNGLWKLLIDKNMKKADLIKEAKLAPATIARDKYLALSKYLDENGLDSDFYPQGSFLVGTTVKPYRDGKEHDYDLDVLAVLKRNKDETNAYSVKNDVGNCIKKVVFIVINWKKKRELN